MKVRAIRNGFFGRYINEGETFEVPNNAKATWFAPVKAVPQAAPPASDANPNPQTNDAGLV